MLGETAITRLPFQQPDGTPLRLDEDYFGNRRNAAQPFPGPFELHKGDQHALKVWPVTSES